MLYIDNKLPALEDMGLYKLSDICNKSLDEWFYSQINAMRKQGFIERAAFELPAETLNDSVAAVRKPVKIAIYGAGNVGKDYFIQAMRRSDVELVAWVDGNYERIGYPIQSPDVLLSSDYDYVIIAVSTNKVSRDITHLLTEKGIPEDKIFYEIPYNIIT